MKHYVSTVAEVFAETESGEIGLTALEAEQRLLKNGKNKLKEAKKTSVVVRFLQQLANPMIVILLIAALISLITVIINNSNPANETESFADVIIIGAVVLLNAVLGVVQESKAEAAIAALQEMTASTCKVLRDGGIVIVKSQDIAVGDVILLEAGDSIPADCRLFECASMKVEEAALTGESVPSNKTADVLVGSDNTDIPLGDRKNMVYMGSTVVYGRGKAVVTAVGMDTEMGKIAGVLAQAEQNETPLQKKMRQLSKVLTYLVIGICAFIFLFKLIMDGFKAATVLDSFMIAIGLAVAAIPEGLATVVTIVLSIGVTNMSKKKAVIRRLTAVETLGCAEIICSDKTGTLTQNKMTVVDSYSADKKLLAVAMAQASDAVIENGEALGEPTECALVNFAYKMGLDKTSLSRENPRKGEAPFDSMRKMMSTVHSTEDGFVQYTKGAPDEILKVCTHIIKDGKSVKITAKDIADITEQNKRMADQALRVLAAAYKSLNALPNDYQPEKIENGLTFVGLTGMIDPIRPEVTAAIAECRRAGIRPIMITGDHIDTAIAIAMQLGIIKDRKEAISGTDLSAISDEDFLSAVEKYSVYARVQPEHKVRIVNTWREKGKITAMTGDGVNDAPSIKSADIGIGMGITGTDVTKNTADMVLADDNFATIVTAVGEGRRIYDNIRKAIQFLLSSNLAEVVAIFAATLLNFTLLKPAHLLWINLITDTFPAIALGMEKGEPDLMDRAPRSNKAGIFSDGLGLNVVLQGVFVAIITLAAYFIGHMLEGNAWTDLNSEDGMTMAFLTMSMAEIFHAYNVRSQHKSIFRLKSHNKILWIAMFASLALTTAVIFVPGVNDAFGFVDAAGQTCINATEYFISVGLALCIIPLVEVSKLIQNAVHRRSKHKASELKK